MSDETASPTGDGVVAVIRKDGLYLLIQRALNIRSGGLWCFVGGAVEPPESQEQALVREVQEEVGLEVCPIEKVWECLSPNRLWRLHCWSTSLQSHTVTPNPNEVADYRWMTPAEISRWPDVLPSVFEFFDATGIPT